jgi:hypothetical protein
MAGRSLPVPVGESPVPPNPKGMESLGIAARNGMPLLRPLPADVAVSHASNYAIVSNHVQQKVKKVAGERDSPPAPRSGGRRSAAADWNCRMQAGQNRKGTLPADHADARRWGKRLLQERTEETEFALRCLCSLMFKLFRNLGAERLFCPAGICPAHHGPSAGRGLPALASVYLACGWLEESIRLSSCCAK